MDPNSGRPGLDRFTVITSGAPNDRPGLHVVSTRERGDIERWAAAHSAQPATGEASASGPAVRSMNDTGAGIRFNFPGFSPFRPITWDEWFQNFLDHDLVFVFEEGDGASGAPDQAGSGDGTSDRAAAVRYRLIKNNAQQG